MLGSKAWSGPSRMWQHVDEESIVQLRVSPLLAHRRPGHTTAQTAARSPFAMRTRSTCSSFLLPRPATSALKLNGKKIDYLDFTTEGNHPDCTAALKRLFPRINLEAIGSFIDQVEVLSDLQREFYRTCIQARYDRILSVRYHIAVLT